jgi:hypothetical protein
MHTGNRTPLTGEFVTSNQRVYVFIANNTTDQVSPGRSDLFATASRFIGANAVYCRPAVGEVCDATCGLRVDLLVGCPLLLETREIYD